ncbi:MAG: hypothetical protein COA47_10125 [Robiginitomaculum sp.]|nr:MAG: hypothetical protein COA47_10125 [Robiginitomaculum sp.]
MTSTTAKERAVIYNQKRSATDRQRLDLCTKIIRVLEEKHGSLDYVPADKQVSISAESLLILIGGYLSAMEKVNDHDRT